MVGIDTVGGVDSESNGGTKSCEVVGCPVDGSNGKCVDVTAGLDEVQHAINSLERAINVSSVIEPALVKQSFANVEVVHTAGEQMKIDNDVHVVLGDGILGYGLQVAQLVAMVEL